MYENVRICHDRLLPREQALMQSQQTVSFGSGRTRAVFLFRKMWINGSRLRVRFIGGNPAQQALVKEQASWWTQHANLTFDFNNAPDAEIRIAFNSSDGAWSYIGTDCQGIPRNQPTMNLGFSTAVRLPTNLATRSAWDMNIRTPMAGSSGTKRWSCAN
jgi:hypothetical protein